VGPDGARWFTEQFGSRISWIGAGVGPVANVRVVGSPMSGKELRCDHGRPRCIHVLRLGSWRTADQGCDETCLVSSASRRGHPYDVLGSRDSGSGTVTINSQRAQRLSRSSQPWRARDDPSISPQGAESSSTGLCPRLVWSEGRLNNLIVLYFHNF